MANKYLSIIDTAYRATIEEQDDPQIWFTHAMKNGGAEVSILLRGDAVNYAVTGQDARGLRFGERAVKGPDLARDVQSAVAKKIPFYVVAEDLAERGIPHDQLIAGVETIARGAVARLIGDHERILSW
ncbi:MAG TPA: DsrE family protein [Kofleriaceae bacterium]|nr:DsrE family protein [Kofleriaceae bacterium]